MSDDEILAVRKIRREISAECGHDVHKVAAYCHDLVDQLRRDGKVHPKDTTRRDAPNRRKTKRK